jgi:hypothetical protein
MFKKCNLATAVFRAVKMSAGSILYPPCILLRLAPPPPPPYSWQFYDKLCQALPLVANKMVYAPPQQVHFV